MLFPYKEVSPMNRLLSVEDGADGAVIRFVPRSVSLDATNAEVMDRLLNALLDGQTPDHLAFDFGPVDFLTSEALGVLLSLHKRVGGRLTLLNLREEVYEVFEATKLTQVLRVRRRAACDH